MASSFTWLDYSERDKRKMMAVIDAFKERDTRDELGIGSVRDGFADLFFPGTSTIQTRAKYFLFVPWIYSKLENEKVSSRKFASQAKKFEFDLISSLMGTEDKEGIIGRQAGPTLKRLPSSVYWQGLSQWGIRRFRGNQSQYHSMADTFHSKNIKISASAEEREFIGDSVTRNWHGGLPPVPNGFPKKAFLALNFEEAEYLQERIIQSAPTTLLAFLVSVKPNEAARFVKNYKPVAFPWEHPRYGSFPVEIKEQLAHARFFSEVIWGASLLYNFMLAQKAVEVNDIHEDRVERYRDNLTTWWDIIQARQVDFVLWSNNRPRFWEIVRANRARVTPSTRLFINDWIDEVLKAAGTGDVAGLIENKQVRKMISDREKFLKGGLARLHNPRMLELWKGAAGAGRLDYRWGRTAQVLVTDILKGLAQK